jgi:hypothetical protein
LGCFCRKASFASARAQEVGRQAVGQARLDPGQRDEQAARGADRLRHLPRLLLAAGGQGAEALALDRDEGHAEGLLLGGELDRLGRFLGREAALHQRRQLGPPALAHGVVALVLRGRGRGQEHEGEGRLPRSSGELHAGLRPAGRGGSDYPPCAPWTRAARARPPADLSALPLSAPADRRPQRRTFRAR